MMNKANGLAQLAFVLLACAALFQSCNPELQGSSPSSSGSSTGTGSGSSGVIQLNWKANVGEQTTFYLEQSTDDVTFTQVQTLSGNSTTTTVTGLTAGKTYYFRLRSSNINGYSGYTSVVSAVP